MHKTMAICAAVWLGVTMLGPDPADARSSFGGYPCKHSCRGYAKGYRWAQHGHVTDPRRCEVGNSMAFRAGCMVYTQEPRRGADTDDDGHPI
jgi:hypothetical protein